MGPFNVMASSSKDYADGAFGGSRLGETSRLLLEVWQLRTSKRILATSKFATYAPANIDAITKLAEKVLGNKLEKEKLKA